MVRFLTILCSGLLCVSCDKPVSSPVHDDQPTSTQSVGRRMNVLRGHASNQTAPPREIFEAALAMESPVDRTKALAAVAWNAIEIDSDLAHDAFQRLPADHPEKIRLIGHYAMRLAEHNAEEAIAWAATRETALEVSFAMGYVALEISESEPLRAANLLSETGIAGHEFDVILVQVIQRWAAQSAQDAATWVSKFPPGAAREAGIKVIAECWLPKDAAAAFVWLDRMQDTTLRVETARAMEGVILQQDQPIRDAWLQHADTQIRGELDQQRSNALKEVGDNIPPS